jgi:hypothetical protein
LKIKVARDDKNRIIEYAIIGNIENSIEEEFESLAVLKVEFSEDQESIRLELESV